MILPTLALMGLARVVVGETTTPNTGDQTLGFLFGFSTSSLTLPITPSCPDPLPITPLTPLDSSGAGDTVGPFTMLFLVREQMMTDNGTIMAVNYAHREEFKEMRELQSLDIPFMNGTQFIACTWSSNLVSGGCQDLFTVVPSRNYDAGYATRVSSCRKNGTLGSWIPSPEKRLDVVLEGPNGAVSEVGWPACCTDLMFTPKNGTPPYTTVISPTQHPPVNISSASITSTNPSDHRMNYTIRYTHGQAFMVSVHDSKGASWAAGPLHAGQSLTDVACLGVRTGELAVVPEVGGWSNGKAIGGIVGGTIGALVLGLVIGWLAGVMIAKKRKRNTEMDPYMNPRPVDGSSESFKNRHVTPYDILAPDGAGDTPGAGASGSHPTTATGAVPNQNVYVVHADAGGDDLHIQLPNPGARVIEMPPDYQHRPRSGSGTGTGTSGTPTGEERRGGGGGGGKVRPRMGLRVSSGAEPEAVAVPPTSPSTLTQVSEKSPR